MSKYSKEFKLKVVNYYMNNNYSWEYVAKQFDIPAWTTVRKYQEHGTKGLIKNQKTSIVGNLNRMWNKRMARYKKNKGIRKEI